MKRVIKFRGKSIHEDVWLYGWLMQATDWSRALIQEFEGKRDGGYDLCAEVIPETVGQFTGLCDAEGEEIYEGDILREGFTGYTFQVVYDAPEFCFKANGYGYRFLNRVENFEVVGNIHDNPELLKGGCNGSC